MDDTLLDEWFTKSQAAAVLQVSEKTIERLARKGEIRRETRKRPGVRPSPGYYLEDLTGDTRALGSSWVTQCRAP